MKIKVLALSCLIATVVFSFVYQRSTAKAAPSLSGQNIGTVDIKKIFRDCQRNNKYRQEATAEQERVIRELKKLQAEIEAEEACIKVLKSGTREYLDQVKEVLTKRANYQAQQEFYKRKLDLNDQTQTEKLYKGILEKTREVAKKRGLALVLAVDEPDLPALNANELMLGIATNKVLYSGGCVDVSGEVMALVDVMN
ncbi:MAG: OmpH family outer membrane protein [Planctomycetota bacterium]|jgi:Skp family chaperone for outer membrane proteins